MGVWNITVKDLRLIVRDGAALFTLLALPVVFIAILGVSSGQLLTTRDELKLLKVGFVDEDQSELSARVMSDLSTIGGLKLKKAADRDEARLWLQDGRSNVIVILGKEFDNRVDDLNMDDVFDAERGKLSGGVSALDMQVESGAAFASVGELIEYVVLSAVMRAVTPEVARRNPFFRRWIDRMAQRHESKLASNPQSSSLRKTVKAGPSIIYQTLVPAFLVMFAFFLVNYMASSFINERTLGTMRRIQISQIGPFQLLLGKTFPFFLVSIIQSVLLFLSGKLMFGMSWGIHPLMLIPVILTTAVSAAGLGLLLATFVQTEAQVASYSTFLVVVLAGISGCYMPRDWLPDVMKNISLATPHAWALIAYQELLTREHPNLSLVSECCGMLMAFGCIAFTIGGLRFRKLEYLW